VIPITECGQVGAVTTRGVPQLHFKGEPVAEFWVLFVRQGRYFCTIHRDILMPFHGREIDVQSDSAATPDDDLVSICWWLRVYTGREG
jgi:hypothetical protein